MGRACSTLVGSKMCINTLVRKPQRVRLFERIRDILDKRVVEVKIGFKTGSNGSSFECVSELSSYIRGEFLTS